MNFAIISTVSIAVAFFSLLLWIFRPNSKKLYDKISQIPLKDDRGTKSEKEKK